jgi:hypothetical protein
MSRTDMQKHYSLWHTNELAFRNLRELDEEDAKALKRKEPVKFVVPYTFGQVDTFSTMVKEMFFSRKYVYELQGMGDEDQMGAEAASALLQRDLDFNRFKGVVFPNVMKNLAVTSIGVVKHSWCRKVKMSQTGEQIGQNGLIQPSQTVEVPVYLGNELRSVSPLQFFPDTRLPIARFEEGEFCASEDLYSFWQLRQMERQGVCAGLDNVKDYTPDRQINRPLFWNDTTAAFGASENPETRPVVVTEVEMVLIPSEVDIGDNMVLGPEDYPVKYVLWYANDNVLIRLEPKDYEHQKFNYDVGLFFPDVHSRELLSLAQLLLGVQETTNWLYNTRIANVRKIVSDRMIVDPRYVNIEDIRNRLPVIRLRDGAPPLGVERFIQQLPISDVTISHINDAQALMGLGKETSGITENLLGQFATGRRSASEANSVNTNAMARIRHQALIVWETLMKPLGEKMLSNHVQALDIAQMVRVLGESGPLNKSGMYFLSVDRSMISGKQFDFDIFDGTLPSDRIRQGNQLQGLFEILLKTPQLAMQYGYNPMAVFEEILTLNGVRNLNRFKVDPRTQQPLVAPPQPNEPVKPIGGPSTGSVGASLDGIVSDDDSAGSLPDHSQFGPLGGLPNTSPDNFGGI